jgi:uncharacterized protein YjbI with pentapeptide repeats
MPFEFEGLPVELYHLVQRRDQGEQLPASETALSLSGSRLVHLDLSGLDLSEADLSQAEVVGCSFAGSRLAGVNLNGALLHDVDFTEAELVGSDLTGAEVANGIFTRAGLNDVRAVETHLYGARCDRASFAGADLTGADLRLAVLTRARFVDATLDDANLDAADMQHAELVETSITGARFSNVDLRSASLKHVSGYREADWRYANVNDADFTGAWNVHRHVLDTNFIEEFRRESRSNEVLYWIWWVTSDCGRSLARWTGWTVLIALFYAVIYTRLAVDFGGNETALSPLYFSVVTFTTLGFGDVLPVTLFAQVVVMSEVILGYVSLGGMMSILSDKMARRAG